MKKLFLLVTLVTAGSAIAMAPQRRPRSAWDDYMLQLTHLHKSLSWEYLHEAKKRLLTTFIQTIIDQDNGTISISDKTHFLCAACHLDFPTPLIGKLIERGADVNYYPTRFESGENSALYYALLGANSATVQLLIDCGADTTARVRRGFDQYSLLYWALYHCRYKNAAVLLDAEFDPQSILIGARDFPSYINPHPLAFFILYTRHSNRLYSNELGIGLLDVRDRNGRTMLEEAQQVNNTALIQLLSNPERAGELYPNAQKEFREIMLEKSNVRSYVRKRELGDVRNHELGK